MNITQPNVNVYEISELDALDPIRVLFIDSISATRLIIQTGAKAYCYYFGAIGDQTGKDFFLACGTDYLVMKLIDYSCTKTKIKQETIYLTKIIDVIKKALLSINNKTV